MSDSPATNSRTTSKQIWIVSLFPYFSIFLRIINKYISFNGLEKRTSFLSLNHLNHVNERWFFPSHCDKLFDFSFNNIIWVIFAQKMWILKLIKKCTQSKLSTWRLGIIEPQLIKFVLYFFLFFTIKRYMSVGCTSLKLILKNFSTMITSNITAPPGIGVDISREERSVKLCIKLNRLLCLSYQILCSVFV